MFAYTLAGGKRLRELTYKVDAEKYDKIQKEGGNGGEFFEQQFPESDCLQFYIFYLLFY